MFKVNKLVIIHLEKVYIKIISEIFWDVLVYTIIIIAGLLTVIRHLHTHATVDLFQHGRI